MENLEHRLDRLAARLMPPAPPIPWVVWHPDPADPTVGTYTGPDGRPIAPDAIPPGTKCYSGIDVEAV